MRPLHHDCRPGTPRAPCGEKRSARVGEAPASRFRGGTHHRTVADGAMPTLAPQARRSRRMNPFYQPKKRDPHTHQTRDISLPRDRWESNPAHGFSGTMITALSQLHHHIAAQACAARPHGSQVTPRKTISRAVQLARTAAERGSPHSAYKGSIRDAASEVSPSHEQPKNRWRTTPTPPARSAWPTIGWAAATWYTSARTSFQEIR